VFPGRGWIEALDFRLPNPKPFRREFKELIRERSGENSSSLLKGSAAVGGKGGGETEGRLWAAAGWALPRKKELNRGKEGEN
jgi:hypothetical protein